eukprot:TRINITY_DN3890_c0_g1_i4.p1 TRINITY_DN3890_c0_g1~~TRINITY_DN3890_c0_g1_i4.p1  ORF type:complete len:507 (-),score=83.68 TRINITY_DN3890_c0_g1_i4:111-1631(-)
MTAMYMAAPSCNRDDLFKAAASQSDSDVEVGSAEFLQPAAERGRGRLLAVGCAALAGAALLATAAARQTHIARAPAILGSRNVEEKVDVSATTASPLVAATLAPAPVVTAAPVTPMPAPLVTAAPLPVTTAAPSSFGSGQKVWNQRRKPSLKPDEGRHDGNVCDDQEELLEGLCYTKCEILTNGAHPFRKSAFSCCKTSRCIDTTHLDISSMLPCEGYDVSTEDGGTACPHSPGICLEDEDQFLNECYEKCSILTNGKYPNRVAAATCCNTEGIACMNPFNDLTSAEFDVGGGKGDGRDSTPSKVHPPLKSLTESAHSNGVLVTTPGPDLANVRRRPVNITPSENMHDGNPCDDTEEYFGGLCYRKCSILTNGEAPFRTSAFACCKVKSCTLALTKMKVASVLPCEGYDVSSEDGGKACPHGSGICLQDEDQYLDECYEKCSILTNGKYSNRVAPATCCDGTGISCMNPFNLETDAKFDVGGGKGDGKKSTPSAPHLPMKSLTEAR